MSGFTNQQALSQLRSRLKVHGPIKNNYHYGDTLIIDFGDMAPAPAAISIQSAPKHVHYFFPFSSPAQQRR
jgi:hypothetical protein